jgi:hypothetical protein
VKHEVSVTDVTWAGRNCGAPREILLGLTAVQDDVLKRNEEFDVIVTPASAG